MYIEDLYKKEDSIKYVITSSTLLEGVNLPAERLFLLDYRRGRSKLSRDAFKNLMGRVCRFSEIFGSSDSTLERLEPRIFIVQGKYFSQRSNCESFLKNVAKTECIFKDNVQNVLLHDSPIDSDNEKDFQNAEEFIDIFENGTVDNYSKRYSGTEIGKSCIVNEITEIDVFSYETEMQTVVNEYKSNELQIEDTKTLLNMIQSLFLRYLPENNFEVLRRLEKEEARNFYAMMLDWRIKNKSYAEMICFFVEYWKNTLHENNNAVVYVGKWGDVTSGNGKLKHYTNLAEKSQVQLVNLAIVRIKEEQDFIDNMLIKYVESIHDLELINENFYLQIKYGTADENIICLLKNGLSLSVATLLIKKYREYLKINVSAGTVIFDNEIIKAMNKSNENKIIINEVVSCM